MATCSRVRLFSDHLMVCSWPDGHANTAVHHDPTIGLWANPDPVTPDLPPRSFMFAWPWLTVAFTVGFLMGYWLR